MSVSRNRNLSRNGVSFVQLHNSIIRFFVQNSSNREVPVCRAIYLCELISIESYAYRSGKLKDDKWFFCRRNKIIQKYKFSIDAILSYEKQLIELGILEKTKSEDKKDSLNYFALNHDKLDEIYTDYLELTDYECHN